MAKKGPRKKSSAAQTSKKEVSAAKAKKPTPHKKGKDIKPLHEKELKKQIKQNKEQAQANADALAELARKTAEIAEKVDGDEVITNKVLKIDEPTTKEPRGVEPKDIYDELDEEIAKKAQRHVNKDDGAEPAVDLIRAKLSKLYKDEPDAAEEALEATSSTSPRSKHQEFIYDLTASGKPLAEIQTAWHEYYVALPNDEKHEVWQEFYQKQHEVSAYMKKTQQKKSTADIDAKIRASEPMPAPKTKSATKTVKEAKDQITDKVSAGGRLKPVHHFKSALFGIGLATFVGLMITFVFFNEVFVAPFISPSTTVSATPIIGSTSEVGPEPKIIIPKINLEVPVVYGLGTIEEDAIQNALEDGVVHYAASPEPGEVGNSVIVGHSSNNILNSGQYKFAFVLLRRLEIDDTFFIEKDGQRYTYKIFEKTVVSPNQTEVLGPSSRDNTMTLITCDPPGTSINRLIIVAEQITPDPAENTEAMIDVEAISNSAELPSNAPSLWSRLWPF